MDSVLDSRPLRFLANGVAATAVHFAILAFCLHVVGIGSAGASNLIASAGGVLASFLGNRHFVFRSTDSSLLAQLHRFGLLYLMLCLGQGLILYLWSDVGGLDYRVGFAIGVAVQAVCTYYGGQHWVFKPRS
ncbi:MAG: GtrA family protein [Xanthomonadales bacterium]|nr:GtrA family protein [Xanthomonadales bacterium]